jgi:hypothetical protein
MLARAEAPAAKRKKLRREMPLQPMGSTAGEVIECEAPSCEDVQSRKTAFARARVDRKNGAMGGCGEIAVPYSKVALKSAEHKQEMGFPYAFLS